MPIAYHTTTVVKDLVGDADSTIEFGLNPSVEILTISKSKSGNPIKTFSPLNSVRRRIYDNFLVILLGTGVPMEGARPCFNFLELTEALLGLCGDFTTEAPILITLDGLSVRQGSTFKTHFLDSENKYCLVPEPTKIVFDKVLRYHDHVFSVDDDEIADRSTFGSVPDVEFDESLLELVKGSAKRSLPDIDLGYSLSPARSRTLWGSRFNTPTYKGLDWSNI